MKLNRLIPLILIFFYTTLFAGYGYNIDPQSSGIVKLIVQNRTTKKQDIHNLTKEDNTIQLTIDKQTTSNGDIQLHVNVDSKYALKHPTLILLDSNGKMIAYKQYSDNLTYLNWTISKSYIANGVHNYTLVYATNNDTYNFAFYFKTIQITKTFIEPEITQIGAASSSNQNSNEGLVGDTFVFASTLSESLPSGYKMYISFEGVNSDGSNSGYYGASYQMLEKSDKVYYYKKIMQKAGNNRHYKIVIKDSNGRTINSEIGNFIVKNKPITNLLKINEFNISKYTPEFTTFGNNNNNEDENYEIKISLSQKPTVISLKSDSGNIYTFYKNNQNVKLVNWQNNTSKFDEVFNSIQEINNKEWILKFSVKKLSSQQNKSFTLVAQDYRAKNSTDFIVKSTKYFTVDKKAKAFINITPDSLSKKIPTSFSFVVKTNDYIKGLKVKTTSGESATVFRGKGSFPDGNINIIPMDNNTWKVTYDISSLSPKTATSNNIGLTFYALNSDGNTLVKETLTVKAYKEDKVDLQKVLNFLEKSSVLNKLDLGVPSNIYTHFSRAEASIILYEFLKLKDPNFALPYGDIGFYKNPFADIDPNSDYYKSVITLANYKGDDNITVFTDKYGAFNPLHNVTRFQFVKMIVEGLNLIKSKDFSNIKGFSDYSQLATDARIYYSTAVKDGLIKGDKNNKLLPYDKLTMFQALTILGRALDMNFTSSKEQFNEPNLAIGEIGNPLGIIPEDQDYDPTVTPIKINNITTQKEGNCTKLTAVATLDAKANGKDYYVWNANFGYFKKITPNNKEVLFCPSTKQPNVDYKIHLLGGDGYMNFATFGKIINKDNYEYVKNITDTNPSEVKFNVSFSVKTHLMQENHLFVISKSGSLYEHNLNIGLEKVAVTLQNENGKTYTIDNAKWDNNSIYFVVPSVKEFYGKFVTVKVDYGTNDAYKSKTFDQVMYQENFIINGTVQPDKTGNYPKYVTINSKEVNVLNGKFMYIAPDGGNYKISIDKNYQTINATLTDENPRPYVYINYIDFDYDNDGVENDKDAFPYDPAASVDSDKDGYPDSYNKGYTSATMPLDKYPNDPKKWSDDTSNTAKELPQFGDNNISNFDAHSNTTYKKIIFVTWFLNGEYKEIIPNGFSGKIIKFSTWWGDHSIKADLNNNNTFDFNFDEVYPNKDVSNQEVNLTFTNGFSLQDYKKWYDYWYDDTHGKVKCWNDNCLKYNPTGAGAIMLLKDPKLECDNNVWKYDGTLVNNEEIYCKTYKVPEKILKEFGFNEISLNKGWNLISANIDLNNLPDTVKYVWQYKQGQWFAYSPISSIQASIDDNGNDIKSIKANDGTWIYSTKEQNIQIKMSQPTVYNFSEGWTLAGTNKDINVSKITCKNGSQLQAIWEFKHNKWLLHTANTNNKTYNSFDTISSNDGFWVDCE